MAWRPSRRPCDQGRRRRGALAVAVVLAAACGCAGFDDHPAVATSRPGSRATSSPGAPRTVVLGYSVRHQPVTAVEVGDPAAPRTVLVVGCVHGDEPAGIAIARALAAGPAAPRTHLWIVPDLDPDGVVAGSRGNAHGVDLNRNFPVRWRPLGSPGSVHYAGQGPLSEPESRAVAALIRRVRPDVGIWFHQRMAVVDISEGPDGVERRFARRVGLPVKALTDYPGSATGWENTLVPDSAFVVELPARSLSRAQMARYATAVREVAASP